MKSNATPIAQFALGAACALLGALSLPQVAQAQTYTQSNAARAYDPSVSLTPLKRRLSDRQVRADIDKMVDLHLRIDRLNTAGNPQAVYHQAQAYTWLEAARTEYLDNNETGWENVAFTNAQRIVAAMEQRQMPQTLSIDSAATSNRYFAQAAQRWNEHRAYLGSNAAELGRQSVLLDWAAYEEQNDPNFINTCVGHKFADINKAVYLLPPPVIVVQAPPPVQQPVVIPRAEVQPLRIYDFPDSVHFALDEYYLAPESKAILDKVVQIMRQYPELKINAVGHTDPRAGSVYNQRLSERRATIVKNYLMAQGIGGDRIRQDFKGETTFITQDVDARGHARNRRTQLSPQEGILIQGANFRITNQERDLQLEKPGESREDNDKRRGVAPVKN
jgi:outer membrane protein OmpA-like peptidoglycan-associated protein